MNIPIFASAVGGMQNSYFFMGLRSLKKIGVLFVYYVASLSGVVLCFSVEEIFINPICFSVVPRRPRIVP